jgi:NIPSNAP
MKLLLSALLCLTTLALFAQKADTRYFELRTYYCAAGQLNPLIERFQMHTTRIFEKNGMENIGYWVPVNNEKNILVYILAFPSKAAREKCWAAFDADKEWKVIQAQSKVKMVDSVVSVFMNASDILPAINYNTFGGSRVFELRTYSCLPGRLPNLITRFKDHTLKLFAKHNMESIAYFTSEEPLGAQPKLVYLLAHPSVETATQSWTDFRADPDWIAARDASEKDGKIVEKVETVFLRPLGFSKIK